MELILLSLLMVPADLSGTHTYDTYPGRNESVIFEKARDNIYYGYYSNGGQSVFQRNSYLEMTEFWRGRSYDWKWDFKTQTFKRNITSTTAFVPTWSYYIYPIRAQWLQSIFNKGW